MSRRLWRRMLVADAVVLTVAAVVCTIAGWTALTATLVVTGMVCAWLSALGYAATRRTPPV